jgi:O-methyltransferase/aklanonic acid methyltransferase
MTEFWSRLAGTGGLSGLIYWQYFGARLVEYASIRPGSEILDVGCGSGSSLFPAAKIAGPHGRAIGIDICPH